MNRAASEGGSAAAGHYSPGVLHQGTLYISGQLSLDPKTREKPATFGGEVIQALENLNAVLQAHGLSKEDVIMCRVYISDIQFWDELNAVYAAWFGDHKPARAVVPTRELHYGCRVEIEAIAASLK